MIYLAFEVLIVFSFENLIREDGISLHFRFDFQIQFRTTRVRSHYVNVDKQKTRTKLLKTDVQLYK